MDCVAVGWLVWVELVAVVVVGRLVCVVFAVGWQLVCCMIGGFAVLWEGRVLAVGGFISGWLGIKIRGWCWWYVSYWLGVGLVGWWAVGRGVCLVWVMRVDVTLSV